LPAHVNHRRRHSRRLLRTCALYGEASVHPLHCHRPTRTDRPLRTRRRFVQPDCRYNGIPQHLLATLPRRRSRSATVSITPLFNAAAHLFVSSADPTTRITNEPQPLYRTLQQLDQRQYGFGADSCFFRKSIAHRFHFKHPAGNKPVEAGRRLGFYAPVPVAGFAHHFKIKSAKRMKRIMDLDSWTYGILVCRATGARAIEQRTGWSWGGRRAGARTIGR